MRKRKPQSGFSLAELLVAMALTGVLMAAAMMLYQKSVRIAGFVSTRAELQSEMRGAMNQIARDLNQAGTGIPIGGIPIPSLANGGVNPVFGCDATRCYLTAGKNVFTTGTLNKVTPANSAGITTSEATDALVMLYMDPIAPAGDATSSATGLNWSAFPTTTVADDGSTLTMPVGTTPVLNDPRRGLVVGDLLLLQNEKGSAVGVVTGFDAATGIIRFASGDPLKINQPAAVPVIGTLASLRISPLPGVGVPHYKPVSVSRIMMISYYVWKDPSDGHLMLMRQVNGRAASPVAEYIEDFQVSFDVLDDSKSPAVLTADLPDAAIGTPAVAQPNMIRKINLRLIARSPQLNDRGQYDRMSIATSVGPRNLSFHDIFN